MIFEKLAVKLLLLYYYSFQINKLPELHEALRSINCFSPVNGMLVCSKVTFITHILRWKNDKRVKEQSLLSKGEMPCRVKLIESRRGE